MSSARGQDIVSLPHGAAEQLQASIQTCTDQHSSTAVDIVVYFAENSGLHLKVVDGQNATASELFEMIMEEQEYPEVARELFSLWLVSDLLELQLKPAHVPFKLVCYWEELLDKYSSASLFERQRDEPVIMFRRNVFCSCEVEKTILGSENMLEMSRLLYSEAKKNVLMGRYPLSRDECDKLAGIQAVIMKKEGSEENFTTETFRSKSMEYLPAHFCKRKWLIGTKDNPEYRLLQSYENQRKACQEDEIKALYCKYLEVCYEKPYYGCAFFRGQVEHPGQRLVTTDDPVYVAINLRGVYIIDEDDFVLLLGLPYKFLCWEQAKPASENAESLPFLVLQFPVAALETHENSSAIIDNRETNLLQIFSKQTPLMDKLIEACIDLRKTGRTTIDPRADQNVIGGQGDVAIQFRRLALRTFNAERKLIKSTVRKPKNSAV